MRKLQCIVVLALMVVSMVTQPAASAQTTPATCDPLRQNVEYAVQHNLSTGEAWEMYNLCLERLYRDTLPLTLPADQTIQGLKFGPWWLVDTASLPNDFRKPAIVAIGVNANHLAVAAYTKDGWTKPLVLQTDHKSFQATAAFASGNHILISLGYGDAPDTLGVAVFTVSQQQLTGKTVTVFQAKQAVRGIRVTGEGCFANYAQPATFVCPYWPDGSAGNVQFQVSAH